VKRKTLFVIMPFGVRPLPSGIEHDFDAFYQDVLRAVALDEGWEVLRVDELVESGTVTNQALKHLYSADLVVADVTSPNSNVYYELGVRQALSPGGTILVAARATELPFDISNQRVLFYDLDFGTDEGFQRRYRQALGLEAHQSENPVRAALNDLGVAPNPREDMASFEREFDWKIDRARTAEQLVAVWHWAKQYAPLPSAGALSLATRLARVEDYATAAAVLAATYPAADTNYEVHRQRGFFLRKLEDYDGAITELERALELNPSDPQSLGMLGGALKRQGRYGDALEKYERGVHLAPTSLYLRVARAGIAVMLAEPGAANEAFDLYQKIIDWIAETPSFVGNYWADLVLAEARWVLGDFEQARVHAENAVRNGAHPVEAKSAAEQIQMIGTAGVHMAQAEGFAGWLVELATSGVLKERVEAEASTSTKMGQLRKTEPYVIFHLSDTHFGTIQRNGNEVDMHRFADSENSDRLAVELKREFDRALATARCGPEAAAVVLSGDLTYLGKPEEFASVHSFLDELCANVGLRRDQVIIVPGNHDVDWTARPDRRFDNYLEFVGEFYGEDLFKRLFPLVTWDFKLTGKRPEPNEIVYLDQSGPVAFVGLNSCIFEDEGHNYGFVGKRQLDNVRSLMPEPRPGQVRAVVMHHHLHPYPEPLKARTADDVAVDLSTIRDAGLVEQRFMKLGISLVMHGHKHRPQLRETSVKSGIGDSGHASKSLIVSGCGSTGVSEHELQHSTSNHFAIIELLRRTRQPGADFLRVEWRQLSLDPGAEWTTTDRWTLKG
jgi:3',5'-cyclic AMP phosphodiesterase CpdA/tetratricopeptide (TPR) repeat protein